MGQLSGKVFPFGVGPNVIRFYGDQQKLSKNEGVTTPAFFRTQIGRARTEIWKKKLEPHIAKLEQEICPAEALRERRVRRMGMP